MESEQWDYMSSWFLTFLGLQFSEVIEKLFTFRKKISTICLFEMYQFSQWFNMLIFFVQTTGETDSCYSNPHLIFCLVYADIINTNYIDKWTYIHLYNFGFLVLNSLFYFRIFQCLYLNVMWSHGIFFSCSSVSYLPRVYKSYFLENIYMTDYSGRSNSL